jgi:hypothetical protein
MDQLPLPSPEGIRAYEHSAPILESIADGCAPGSVERDLLKKAAFALFFSTVYYHEEFEAFLSTFTGNLSDEQKAHLKGMGIDPDAPDA